MPTHFRFHHRVQTHCQENSLSRGAPWWNSWLYIFNHLRQTFAISAVNEKKSLFCFSFQYVDLWSRCNYSTLSLIHLEKLSWILNNFCSRQVTEIHNNCSAFQILLQIFHIFRRFRWRTWWKLLNWIAAVQLKHSFTFLAKERVTIVTCCKVWLTKGHTYDLYREGGRSRTSLKDCFWWLAGKTIGIVT